MSTPGTRPSLNAVSEREWDLIVVGGGITGAGVFEEAAQRGLRVLLVEQNDFASGTSSRSSKMIHGGLHYLARGRIGLVRQAVGERERMLASLPGLVDRVECLMPVFGGDPIPATLMDYALTIYGLIAGHVQLRHRVSPAALERMQPAVNPSELRGVFAMYEGQVDDARLVLRVLSQGCRAGGIALNYVAVTDLVRDGRGEVIGARLHDREGGERKDVLARAVVNATGPWTDALRSRVGRTGRTRLVRGSHLFFARERLPVTQAILALHPEEHLPLVVIPWKNVTLVGSTEVEHTSCLDREPRATGEETEYLLRGLRRLYPTLGLGRADILATSAGVRPLADRVPVDSADASREHAIWCENGLLTITGGKLTTYHVMAREVLDKLRPRFPAMRAARTDGLAGARDKGIGTRASSMPLADAQRIVARYGTEGLDCISAAPLTARVPMYYYGISHAELSWVLRNEAVHHLDDLLMRRFRFGLTLPQGGIAELGLLRGIVQSELSWEDARWRSEVDRYRENWRAAHGVTD